jgi:hypothetical protein
MFVDTFLNVEVYSVHIILRVWKCQNVPTSPRNAAAAESTVFVLE